jgi:cytochrome c2
MRKTKLMHTSIIVAVVLVSAAVALALLRALVIHPADSFAGEGSGLFKSKGCAQCHYTDSSQAKMGPGLKGLFKQEKLPVSGRKVTEANVRRQLTTPYKNMPSFADRLTVEEKDQLIAFLKTL